MQIYRNRRKDIKPTMEGQNKSLFQLFVPLCLETIFYMLSGMVDTLMLSSVGDQAVGAVGTANTYIGVFIIMYSVVSMGMLAVMTQNIGAGRPGIACQAKTLGLWFNGILGVVMSVFLFFCSDGILYVVGIAPALKEPAVQYLRIVGGGSILNAMIPILAGYLRAFGYTKQPLIATVTGNILNFILNAVFLFRFPPRRAGGRIRNSDLQSGESDIDRDLRTAADPCKKIFGEGEFRRDFAADHPDRITFRFGEYYL